jgi:hypothetical protein
VSVLSLLLLLLLPPSQSRLFLTAHPANFF